MNLKLKMKRETFLTVALATTIYLSCLAASLAAEKRPRPVFFHFAPHFPAGAASVYLEKWNQPSLASITWLAEGGPNAWEAVGILTAVAGVLIAAYGTFSQRAQERTVTISPDAATKHDLDAHKARCSQDVKDLHAKIERVQSEINGRINAMSRDIGVISGQNELQSQRLAQIDAKLDRLIERKNS